MVFYSPYLYCLQVLEMVKKSKDKKKTEKTKKTGKKKDKEEQRWSKVKKKDKKLGEAKVILPSPYENERIVLREKEFKGKRGRKTIEINAVRENTKGKKEKVGKKVVKEGGELARKGEKPYEAKSIKVKEDYRGSKIATSMSELARNIVKRDSGEKKPIYEADLTEKGKKYMEERGIKEKDMRRGARTKAFYPEQAKKEGLYIKQGREEKAIEPKKAVEKIKEKGKDVISDMIERGEIQRNNYKDVVEKLGEEGKVMEAYRLERKMEKIDTEGLNM